MSDNLTEKQKQEYDRWQGYANSLLLAMTVIFAGGAIAFPKNVEFTVKLSSILGLVGIVITVCWFAFEVNWRTKKGKPILLWLASLAFGSQVGFLLAAMFVSG